jgi:hypothetical protein
MRQANDPVVNRLITKQSNGRLALHVERKLDLIYLQTAIILHARGSEKKSIVARNREKKTPQRKRGRVVKSKR